MTVTILAMDQATADVLNGVVLLLIVTVVGGLITVARLRRIAEEERTKRALDALMHQQHVSEYALPPAEVSHNDTAKYGL